MLRWADWAETEIARWDDIDKASSVANLDELAGHVAKLMADNLRTSDQDG